MPVETSTPTFCKRAAEDRGHANHGWLDARFTFSFAEYYDPEQMGFRALRVMNNDTIAPRGGFPMHPHSNMEIFTYVIEGELEHQDSMGNGAVLSPGKLQYMSAASGIRHSEFNPSEKNKTRLYQIWLEPNEIDGEPRYEERDLDSMLNALTLLYSVDGRKGSTKIRQNADIFYGETDASIDELKLKVAVSKERPHAWIQIISGEATVSGNLLLTGDGLAVKNAADGFEFLTKPNSKFLLFRLS